MSPPVPPAERHRGLVAIGVTTLLWSVNFIAARPAAVHFDPFVLTFFRAAGASLVFVPLLLLGGGGRALCRENLVAAVPLAAACILANQVLFMMASARTTPAHVALIIATVPVFVAIAARFLLAEHLAMRRIVGIGVAFAGVVLLALQRGLGGSKVPSLEGDALAVAAAFSFALFTVGNKALVGRIGAFPATTVVYLVGSFLVAPLALPGLLRLRLGEVGREEWLSAAYVVVAATVVAYSLFSYALARLTASRVAVFTYLQPVIATSISIAIGWEGFSPGMAAAAALALVGVALAQRRA